MLRMFFSFEPNVVFSALNVFSPCLTAKMEKSYGLKFKLAVVEHTADEILDEYEICLE